MAKFIVWGPDGLPIRERPFSSQAAAERGLRDFVRRFSAQGYYASVNGKLSLPELASQCRLEQIGGKS